MNKITDNKYTPIISLIGVLTMPLMSIPIMPSDYRPIGNLFLLIPALLYCIDYIFGRKISLDELTLLIFSFTSLLQSLVFTGLNGLGWLAAARGFLPIALGVGCYISIKKLLEYDMSRTISYLTTTMGCVCVIGLIETLTLINIVPWNIKEIIGIGFSGIVNSRLQLTTQEASWAARILIFSFPLFLYTYRETCQKRYIYASICNAILFLVAFSLDGIFIVLIAAILYTILSSTIKFELIVKITIRLSILILFFILTFYVLAKFQEDSYFIGRLTSAFDNFEVDPEFIALLDGSTFIRAFYPIIAFKTFIDHPLGVGAGNFPIFFNLYIDQDYAYAFGLIDEVATNYNELSGSPKSLYARLLAEHGLLSGCFFIIFIFWHLKIAAKQYRKKMTNMTALNLQLVVISLASIIQFASFAYMFMWFSFALNATIFTQGAKSEINK